MDQLMRKVKKESADLKAEYHILLDKDERSNSEQYKVDNFEKELARLETRYNTLVTALANALALTRGVLDMPPFEPSNYSLDFPFFEKKPSDDYIDILGRDDVIKKINRRFYDRLNKDKYWPIIISTSRGMGKTFFLKKFGMQQIKDNLKTDIIGDAKTCGRILSFDFAKHPYAIQNEKDVKTFFPRLMIYFLCRIFDGAQVDGINFEEIKLFDKVTSFIGKQVRFNEWLVEWRSSNSESMMGEYIRLTNITFGTAYGAPPRCFFWMKFKSSVFQPM